MMMDEDSAGQKKNNTLKFAICACAVASLSEVECQQIFGDIQAVLLNNFQSATRQALLEASFLRIPDLDLLRAHVIFLVCHLSVVLPTLLANIVH